MKNLSLIIPLILLLFCACDDYKNINSTLRKIVKLGEKKYNLNIFGTGVAAPENIKNFRLTFRTQKKYNLEEARKLIIDFTEDYINLISSSPEVLKYMENPPINEKHIFLLIIFEDSKGDYVKNFPAIDLANGEISFLKLREIGGFEDNFIESYSEAYFKVYGTEPPIRN